MTSEAPGITPAQSVVAELADKIRAGVPGAVARGITWCETGGERAAALLSVLPARSAHVVGLTGPPGAGKSTLVGTLIRALRGLERRVGVIAVDPSSPLTGGALLGDRVRLEGVAGDRGVFFRSLASRGATGGLSDATRAATTVLSAAGFDDVLVETVGAGQSEVEIMRVADTVAVVLTPGAGDEMQALKAGIMEIADVFVLNKTDQAGSAELKSHLVAAMRTREKSDWRPPFVQTVATLGTGIAELVAVLDRHRVFLTGGELLSRAAAGVRAELLRQARTTFAAAAAANVEPLLVEVLAGRTTESSAARELVARTADALRSG